ncbi:TOMM precursor leader peptide-binding protein [Plantibacter sp. Mn2098]|uniref:TOMM precursor leader peptide-binding protein n=1 Tax=Plantibacter sp. Mn2098 TaxID=3395266 RepID=UPI003BED5BC7
MLLQISPNTPVVWRTPRSLQFGVDEAIVVLDDVDTDTERIVAALQRGVDSRYADRLATVVGAPEQTVRSLVDALGPVIERRPSAGERPTPPERHGQHGHPEQAERAGRLDRPLRVAVDGDGPTAGRLRTLLAPHADIVPVGSAVVDLAVVCAHYVIHPQRYARWLRDDVRHLPVVFGDRFARIGPLVVPGIGPCLYCLDQARTDADPAWPAIASQLLTRESPIERPLLSAECATRTARLVLAPAAITTGAEHERQILIDATSGEVTRLVVRPHPRCACRSLPGTATGPDARPETAPLTRTG